MGAHRFPMTCIAGVVFASATLVPVGCFAQGGEGCADLKVVPRLPASIIVSCDKGDSIEVILPLKPDAQGSAREKSVRGHYEFREYQIM